MIGRELSVVKIQTFRFRLSFSSNVQTTLRPYSLFQSALGLELNKYCSIVFLCSCASMPGIVADSTSGNVAAGGATGGGEGGGNERRAGDDLYEGP